MSNFLGEHSYQTVIISKLGYPAPLVSIQGTNPMDTTYSDELVLRADAELPEMSCVADSLSDAKMTYVWTETTGKYKGSIATTNPRVLRIAKEQLLATESYEFSCFVALTDTPSSNNSALLSVVVQSQPVKARVAGGAERVSGTDQPLELDASGSVDPDAMNTSFSYAWSCSNATTGEACNATATMGLTNATVTMPPNSLSPGTYVGVTTHSPPAWQTKLLRSCWAHHSPPIAHSPPTHHPPPLGMSLKSS